VRNAEESTSITATCPQCSQATEFVVDPNRLGPSGRDRSNLWVCSNPTCGYVAEYEEINQRRIDE
jgi:hypothetical protein